ncbi:MAG TPA: flagellar basal body P-ring formation chaperone FlgA [Spongiibacteraceae bacterium]|nr:flagellar basal body P-ring formation chaperone FlgA [Spongiibacteraceae bacterium]
MCGILLALSATAPVQALENPQLREAVDRFMSGHVDKLKKHFGGKTRVEYSVGTLDSRQTVPACPAPLKVEARESPQTTTYLNLQVSCVEGGNWSLYVPIELKIYRPVVVAVKPLTQGATIAADDVRLSEANISQIAGQYISDLDEVIGKDVKRGIASGSPVLGQQLVPPMLVRRGEAVVISAASNVVGVKVSGIALTDGRLGEQIRFKNLSSNRIVQAKIVASGQAEVPM